MVGVWQGVATLDMVFGESISENVTFARDPNDEKKLPCDNLEEVKATASAKVLRQA